ncbi:MAG: hypothetical protein Q9223_007303 [Gallowayella weberi]
MIVTIGAGGVMGGVIDDEADREAQSGNTETVMLEVTVTAPAIDTKMTTTDLPDGIGQGRGEGPEIET